jgi:hypothetical protein
MLQHRLDTARVEQPVVERQLHRIRLLDMRLDPHRADASASLAEHRFAGTHGASRQPAGHCDDIASGAATGVERSGGVIERQPSRSPALVASTSACAPATSKKAINDAGSAWSARENPVL